MKEEGENGEEQKKNCKREGGNWNGRREKFQNEERPFFFFLFFSFSFQND